MNLLTKEQLKKIMTHVTELNIQKYLDALNNAMEKFEINTPKRQAAFLSQIAVESGELRFDTELPSAANGFDFSKYENKKILGNNQPGDGAKYRGRGLLQLTGRDNYFHFSKKLKEVGIDVDLILEPELAKRPDISVIIACQYFIDRKINELADTGDITEVCKKVNGGLNGINARINFYNKAISVLS